MSNWLDRGQCRGCGKQKGAKKLERLPGAGPAWPPLPGAAAKPEGKDAKQDEKQERPPAPEARAAETEAQAAAIEASAAPLRAAGLTERAAALEAEAAKLRKQASTTLAPGRRLDLAEGDQRRCEGRSAKAKQAVADAGAALQEARKADEAAEKELAETNAQLTKRRNDLATG